MSDFSSQNSNFEAAVLRAKQIAAKIHSTSGQGIKRSLDEGDDLEGSNNKRFSGGSDYNANSPTMSPAYIAQQAAAQVAARLQGGSQPGHMNPTGVNPDAIQKAREVINKMVNQSNGGGGQTHGGGAPRAGLGSNNYTEIMIPGSKVGLIIGKGGETIKQLQEKTGAKMVVIQDGPGQEMEKPLRISGDPQKVEHAKSLVYDLIQDKGDGAQQPNSRPNFNNNRDMGGGHMGGGDQLEIFVPKAAVGVVIGKGGDMIKKIQNETGCRLQFLQTKGDGHGDRRCIIQGNKDQKEDGKRMIEDLIDNVLRRNNGNGGNGGSHGQNEMYGYGGNNNHQQPSPAMGGVQVVHEQYQFIVPASKCGIIIGRNGDTIKQINQQSGAHCEMDRKTSSNQTVEKTFTIKGEQHQVDEAKRLITDKINMDINLTHIGSSTVTQPANGFGQQNAQNLYQQGWGYGAAQGWDQSQGSTVGGAMGQMSQPGGAAQPDYSQQWIEYYRQMGMHREADAIEQQVKAKQATGQMPGQVMPQGTPSQSANGAPTGGPATMIGQMQVGGVQQDYSAEWAEYYRKLGKHEEAEIIEKQMQTAKSGSSNSSSGASSAPLANAPAASVPQNMAAYQQYQQQYYGGAGNANAYQQPQHQQQQQYQYPGVYPGQQQVPGQQPQSSNQGSNNDKN